MRLKAAAALFLSCWAIFAAHAESGRGEARLTSARVVEVTPGKIVTASILIANRSDGDAVYEEAFGLPKGWQRISPLGTPLSIPAGTQQLRLVAFAVPATSPAGSFDVEYVLTDSRNRSPVAIATVTVVVLPVVKLELTREDQTDTVIAGDSYEVTLRLINRGNSRLKVSVVTVAPVSPVHLDFPEFEVEAASSQMVRALVKTDVELSQPSTQVITFKATAAGSDGAPVSATQSAVVTIIPRITGDRDPYARMPAQLRLIAVAENGRSRPQAEFAGGGFLDEDRERSVEFLFRGPSVDKESIYGLKDEHRVNYFGPKFDIYAGDQNYALSPLTQRFSYGRGAGVTFHPGPTTAGAFYMKTRERTRNIETAGSYIRRDLTPVFSLQGNVLYKTDSGLVQRTGPLSLVSLQPHLNFGRKLDLDLEYALSTAGSGAAGQAHRVQAQGQLFEGVVYSVERVQAGNEFFGYYHGTETTQAAVTFPIYGPLRGKASFNQDARDSAADFPNERPLPQGITASRQTAIRPGLMLRVSPRTDLSLEYQNVDRHAAMQTGPEDSLEHSVRFGVGHSQGKFSAQTFAEFGTVGKNSPTTGERSFGREAVDRYSAFLFYRPSVRQAYSVYGTLGSSATIDVTERSQTLGASAQWNLSQRLNAMLSYARNAYDSRTARVQDTATSTVQYTLANRNLVGLQGRWIKDSSTGQSGTSVLVSYTIPFSLRASKKKSGGVIRGRILEFEGESSRPMSRVVVTANGITAVTDRNGQFVFPSLKPGLYQLNVEQRSLGADRVTLEALPITVEVGKGGVVELSIGVVRSTRLSAKIAVFASPQRTLAAAARLAGEATFEEIGGLAAGLVELSNGKQVLRQTTDRDGEVSFEQLRPGKWTLRVYQNNLPEHHVIETPEIKVELEPGQSNQAFVRVLPKVRPIHFIDEGFIAPQSRN